MKNLVTARAARSFFSHEALPQLGAERLDIQTNLPSPSYVTPWKSPYTYMLKHLAFGRVLSACLIYHHPQNNVHFRFRCNRQRPAPCHMPPPPFPLHPLLHPPSSHLRTQTSPGAGGGRVEWRSGFLARLSCYFSSLASRLTGATGRGHSN